MAVPMKQLRQENIKKRFRNNEHIATESFTPESSMYKSILKQRFRHYLCFGASHNHFEEDRFDLHLLISRHKKFMRKLLLL